MHIHFPKMALRLFLFIAISFATYYNLSAQSKFKILKPILEKIDEFAVNYRIWSKSGDDGIMRSFQKSPKSELPPVKTYDDLKHYDEFLFNTSSRKLLLETIDNLDDLDGLYKLALRNTLQDIPLNRSISSFIDGPRPLPGFTRQETKLILDESDFFDQYTLKGFTRNSSLAKHRNELMKSLQKNSIELVSAEYQLGNSDFVENLAKVNGEGKIFDFLFKYPRVSLKIGDYISEKSLRYLEKEVLKGNGKWTNEEVKRFENFVINRKKKIQVLEKKLKELGYPDLESYCFSKQQQKGSPLAKIIQEELAYNKILRNKILELGPYTDKSTHNDLFKLAEKVGHPRYLPAIQEAIDLEFAALKQRLEFLGYSGLESFKKAKNIKSLNFYFNEYVKSALDREIQLWVKEIQLIGFDDLPSFLRHKKISPKQGLTSEIKSLIEKEQQLIKQQLSHIGFKQGEWKANLQRFKTLNKLPENTTDFRSALNQQFKQNLWYSEEGIAYRTVFIEVEKNAAKESDLVIRCIEVPDSPNTYIRIDIPSDFSIEQRLSSVLKNNQRAYSKKEVGIISFVEDLHTQELLQQSFKGRNIQFKMNKLTERQIMAGIIKKIQKSAGKTLFVVGHVEGNQFVTRVGKNVLFQIEIEKLYTLAKLYKVNIFPFGCNTVRTLKTVGTSGMQNSFHDVADLILAISKGNNFGDIIKNFADNTRKLIVDVDSFQNQGYQLIKAKQSVKWGTGILFGAGGLYQIIIEQNKEEEVEDKDHPISEENQN